MNPGYTSNYNNGYRTYTTYGKNYSDTIMMMGRDYQWDDVIPSDHPASQTVIDHITQKEQMIGREMTLNEARSYAENMVGEIIERSDYPVYTGQPSPDEIESYTPGGIDFGKIVPFAAAGVLAFFLFR